MNIDKLKLSIVDGEINAVININGNIVAFDIDYCPYCGRKLKINDEEEGQMPKKNAEETMVQKATIDRLILFRKLIANTNRVLCKRETSNLSEYEKGYRQGQYDTNENLLQSVDELIGVIRNLNKGGD